MPATLRTACSRRKPTSRSRIAWSRADHPYADARRDASRSLHRLNAPAGTVLATVEVTMSPPGAPFLGALVSSNPLFTFRGMNVVLARAYTRADNGKIYTARITALAQ